jgi:predicted dehydrogenase
MKWTVGVIGANPERGWAGSTHIPAIGAVPELQLVAVGTSNPQSAELAQRKWGVQAYSDPYALISDDSVAIVSISVKTPDHAPLVEAALKAGKPVYCEWPLGRNLVETEQLAALAAERDVTTAIGLQGRASPWIAELRRMIEEGYVGRMQSVNLTAWDLFSTGVISPGNAYMIDPANGATPLTIIAGHTLDSLFYLVGEPAELVASGAITVPEIRVGSTGPLVRASSLDQITVVGRLSNGAVFSTHIRAGRAEDETARVEIRGTEGFLRIVAREGYIHWDKLEISGRRGDEPLAPMDLGAHAFDARLPVQPGPGHNVAYAYRAFARRLERRGNFPDFDVALMRYRIIDQIQRATAMIT